MIKVLEGWTDTRTVCTEYVGRSEVQYCRQFTVASKLRLFRALRRDVEIIVKPIMDVAHLEAV